MTVDQARKNLLSLLNHPDMKLNWQEHCGLRQSLELLYDRAKEKEEDKKECPPPQANIQSET